MHTRSISVTEAARNFSDCVNRARYQGVTFILHRNGIPVARIVPEAQKQPATDRETPAPGAGEPRAVDSFTASPPPRSLW
jgi:antitoxin (DNA-binding transcriptional repressor) of toxin-antitoxin stability system